MGTSTQLLTFAEFERVPDPREGKYELRHGELALVAPAKHLHYKLQIRLTRLLQDTAGSSWVAGTEMPFRPTAEYEYWFADVGLIAAARFEQTSAQGNIDGVPEMVIEVLSPSNTVSEMRDRADICLRNGAREFWLVDPERQTVEVTTPDGHTIRYQSGQDVPLWFGGKLAVAEIFA
jgi:Uma2 family endonuclease